MLVVLVQIFYEKLYSLTFKLETQNNYATDQIDRIKKNIKRGPDLIMLFKTFYNTIHVQIIKNMSSIYF